MKKKRTLFFLMIFLIIFGCKREYGDFYDPPKGQESEIYAQLSANPDLSTFVSAIDLVPGLKEELSSSGLFTVLAPDNDAFQNFFSANSNYNSLEEIPENELSNIVKYHIMKWMLFQYNFLNPASTGNNENVYKYETRANFDYSDKSLSGKNIPLYYSSKMLQVYTPEYWAKNNLSQADYADVYGNDAVINSETKLNFMEASAKQIDISAGNGCLYILDKVLTPPNNIAQELDLNTEFEPYNQILKKYFLHYEYDMSGTIAQGNNGDINGDGLVDSLFVRQYGTSGFLDEENPRQYVRGIGDVQMSLTAYIPTKNAFEEYLNNKLLPSFYNTWDSVPDYTISYLFNSHLSADMEWPSSLDNEMARNLYGDKIELSRSEIESIKMASNGLVYTTSKTLEPKVFNAAPGPIFFSPTHTYFARMLVITGRAQILTNDLLDLTVFAPSDLAFKLNGIIYDPEPLQGKPGFYDITESDPKYLSASRLLSIIGNHVLIKDKLSTSDILQTDGFYPTWNGSYLVVEDGVIHGSSDLNTTTILDPDHEMSNGYYHGVSNFIRTPEYTVFEQIKNATAPDATIPYNSQYRKFRELCIAADILNTDFESKELLTDAITDSKGDKRFTLFVPSNEAITEAQIAGLLPPTGEQGSVELTDEGKIRLAKYLSTFFVQDAEIFTDGKTTGSFLSARLDEASSTFGNEIYFPVTISLPALTVTLSDGSQAKVIMSDKENYPQDRISVDGVIHVIDNAFTSQY